jgi:FeS assembly SUF system regulator
VLRISRLTDYGIVLLTRFASDRTTSVHTARDLAAEVRVPAPTVSKILKALAHVGILESHRGASGGFSLARPAERISVAEVIEALDGPIAMTECLGEEPGACEIESGCPVRSNWDRINRTVRDALVGLTIADMARPAFLRRRPLAVAIPSGSPLPEAGTPPTPPRASEPS